MSLMTKKQIGIMGRWIDAALPLHCAIYRQTLTVSESGGTQAGTPILLWGGPVAVAPANLAVSEWIAVRADTGRYNLTLPVDAVVGVGDEVRVGRIAYEVTSVENRQYTTQALAVLK